VGPRLEEFAVAIQNEGSMLPNCWGFIDGTVKRVCRPSIHQEELYNGRKGYHCLVFQGLVTPDGLFTHFFGGIAGSRHDQYVLTQSNLLEDCRGVMAGLDDVPYMLFGDKGYTDSDVLLTPYRSNQLNPDRRRFNKSMSRVRIAVEWMFGVMKSLWGFMQSHHTLRLLSQPVSVMVYVAAFLTNCHACLYGNIVSDKFGVNPTRIRDYLGLDVEPPEEGDTDSDRE
jgi:hypothetical protein